MMNALIALGLGIIVFALIVATGLVVMTQFSSAVSNCPALYAWNKNASGYNFGTNTCCNLTANECTGGNTTGASQGSVSLTTMQTYVQSNLVTWIPAVIALGIGLLFIGALMGKKNKY
jgi:hypothetical protein